MKRHWFGWLMVTVAGIALLSPTLGLGATRVFDFQGAAYGNPDEACANGPTPPLFNRPEYGSQSAAYIVDPAGCGQGVMVPTPTSGSDSALTAQVNGTNSNVLRFSWENPADDKTWARIITGPAQGVTPLFPNPTVDLGVGGKISMKIAIYAFDAALNPNPTGQLEFALAVRETGVNLPLGENGGASGAIEYIGIDSKGVDTDTSTPIGGVALTHSETFTWQTVQWEVLSATQVEVTIDGGSAVTKSVISFNAGDGQLNATYDRGTIDSLVIRKPVSDTTSKKWFVWVDDITIESPNTDPVQIVAPVKAFNTSVTVVSIDPTATEVKLYKTPAFPTNPVVATSPPEDFSDGAHVFTGLTMAENDVLTATQVVGTESAPSAPVIVTAAGTIDNFSSGVTVADHPQPGNGNTWYDVSNVAYASPSAATLGGSPAMKVADGGYTNGVYRIYENAVNDPGTYHVRAKVHVVETGGVLDGIRAYMLGVTVNGVHRAQPGAVAAVQSFASYSGLTTGDDTSKGPQILYTQEFTAQAGDDLLIAFSTDVTSGSWNQNSAGWGASHALVDDLELVAGPPPVNTCNDIPMVDILGPLGAGDTTVTVSGVGAVADGVTVYSGGTEEIGFLNTSTLPGGNKIVTLTRPLVKDEVLTATQTYGTLEGCNISPNSTVGTGYNTPVRLSLGIRESTITGAAIGSDGGVSGGVEWVAAPPNGKPLTPSASWQQITFYPATDPIGNADGGDGVLDASAGKMGVLESIGVALDPAHLNSGSFTLYVDDVLNGPPGSETVVQDFEGFAAGTEQVMFRKPRYLSPYVPFLLPAPNVSIVDDAESHGGTNSARIEFQFRDAPANRLLRVTTFSLSGIPSPHVPNPLVALDQPISLWVLYLPGPASPPVMTAAKSVRTHAAAGDLDLDVSAGGVVEPRTGGVTKLVVTFDNNIQQVTGTNADVSLSSGTVSSLAVSGQELTIVMSGATNQAPLVVGFPGIADAGDVGQINADTLCIRLLATDASGDGVTNIFDLIAIRNALNQPVAAGNFTKDVDVNGLINIFDLIAARNNLNKTVIACP